MVVDWPTTLLRVDRQELGANFRGLVGVRRRAGVGENGLERMGGRAWTRTAEPEGPADPAGFFDPQGDQLR